MPTTDTIEKPVTETPTEKPAAPAAAPTDKPATDVKPDTTAKPAATSLLDDAGDDDDDAPAPTDKPATDAKTEDGTDAAKDAKPVTGDWRARMAGTDEKALKVLTRYADEAAFFRAHQALQQKLSSGEYRKVLPDTATDAEKAEWRKEMGVPDKPEGYQYPEVKGYEWSDADKQIAQPLLERLHKSDVPQKTVDEMLKWYPEIVAQQMETINQIDVTDKQAAEDTLRSKWEADYRPNINLLSRYLHDETAIPKGLGALLIEARTPEGHRLINTPEAADWLVSQARAQYGDGAMIYGDAKNQLNSREEEIKKIQKTDINRYYSEKLDQELLDIARRKAGSRGRAA